MKRVRHKYTNRRRCLYSTLCFIIGCSVLIIKFSWYDAQRSICLPKNPDDEIIDRQDEWQYQNGITGQWYHWRTVYKRRNNQTEWRANWLNAAPKSYLGVIVYLATFGDLKSLQTSLTQLSRMLSNNPRPVAIFHEDDLSNNDIQQSLAQILGNSTPLTFEHIKFSNISIQPGRLHRRWAPKYFHMCRFFTLMLPNHPLLTLFSYYWRLDTHSYVFGGQPIEDPFEIMQKRKTQYAFTMANRDNEVHTIGLWTFFHQFLQDHCLKPSKNFLKTQPGWIDSYSTAIFFTNLAIANVSLFRDHPLIRAWLHRVDRSGNIYRYRWGDAPVHTLILTQLIPRNQILRLRYFGYMHRNEYVCAKGIKDDLCKAQIKTVFPDPNLIFYNHPGGCNPSFGNPLCHYYPEITL